MPDFALGRESDRSHDDRVLLLMARNDGEPTAPARVCSFTT
jgi:hypothetical protein